MLQYQSANTTTFMIQSKPASTSVVPPALHKRPQSREPSGLQGRGGRRNRGFGGRQLGRLRLDFHNSTPPTEAAAITAQASTASSRVPAPGRYTETTNPPAINRADRIIPSTRRSADFSIRWR